MPSDHIGGSTERHLPFAPSDAAGDVTRQPLRVLLVEDSDADAELLSRSLERAYDTVLERVQTEQDMSGALEDGPWDLILSDFSLPRFSALDALALVKRSRVDVPFIVVSGTVGEDVAVEAMRAGAHDFLLKDRLQRLVPAIERELREAAGRRERARMQEQLVISDRMASVGILAAGVAHEINNPLAVLVANLEIVEHELGQLERAVPAGGTAVSLSDIREPLADASEAASRVLEIAKDLRIFSRSREDTPEAGSVDLRAVIDSSVRMARTETRHRARVVTEYPAEMPHVVGNESRLGQVILNLVINAAHAMPEGRVQEHTIRIRTSIEHDGARVEVRDDGAGIAPEHLPRIFEPFFTTKPAGVGTGLGLAICHRIVTSFGGCIEVESQPGRGTAFTLFLQVARPAVPEQPARPASQRTITRARVLILDDEVALAAAVRRLLSAHHDMEVATNGADVLARIRAGDRFDVILCDLMMPQMTGMDFHAELQRIAPDQAQRVVFCSGGTLTSNASASAASSGRAMIEKPFDRNALLSAIAAVLESVDT